MILQNLYWVFEKALSDKQCDEVIDLFKKNKQEIGTIGLFPKESLNSKFTKKQLSEIKKHRNSNVIFRSDSWLYEYTHSYIRTANKNAGWNFQWDWSEACQLTKYSKNQYYHWHQDSNGKPYENNCPVNYLGKIRKLSSVVVLNNADEYKGGVFQIAKEKNFNKYEILEEPLMFKKGAMIVFPSSIWHRVTPVTKGTRYSLTNWHLGNPFL